MYLGINDCKVGITQLCLENPLRLIKRWNAVVVEKIYYVIELKISLHVISTVCRPKVLGTVILLPSGVPYSQAEKDTFKT